VTHGITIRGRGSVNKRNSAKSSARAKQWRMQDCHVPESAIDHATAVAQNSHQRVQTSRRTDMQLAGHYRGDGDRDGVAGSSVREIHRMVHTCELQSWRG